MQILGIMGPIEIFLITSLTILLPVLLIGTILFIVNKWVNKSLEVKRQQNELLKEVLKSLGKGSN